MELAQHGQAIHPRHLQIKERQIDPVPCGQIERFFPSTGSQGLVAGLFERTLEHPAHVGFVVDD